MLKNKKAKAYDVNETRVLASYVQIHTLQY